MRVTRRIATLFGVVSTTLAMAAGPALAGSMYLYKESRRAAQTSWTQIDGTDPGTSPVGNVHVGSLYVFETSNGRGFVLD